MRLCNMWCHPTIQESIFWCATMWCYYDVGATTCGCYHHPTIYFNSNKQQKHFNKKIHKIFPCATTMWCHHFRDRSGFLGHGDCFRPLSKVVLLPNGGDPNYHPLPSCSLVLAASSRLETVDRCPPGLRPHHSRARRLGDQTKLDPNVIRCLVLHEVLMDFKWIYIYRYIRTIIMI